MSLPYRCTRCDRPLWAIETTFVRSKPYCGKCRQAVREENAAKLKANLAGAEATS